MQFNHAEISIEKQHHSKYLIYTRKSTDDAENQKNSIDYQIREALKMCERAQLTVAPVTIEGFCTAGIIKEHHSGFKQDEAFSILSDGTINQKVERPKFLILIDLLQKKQIMGIICLCWDRISRNEADDVIIKKLIIQGIDIRFVQTTYDKSSSGALHMDIDGAFSRHYSRVISEKVKNTTMKLREEGKCTYRSPIGYLDNGSDNKSFDEERVSVVKRIFQLYATGEWSYTKLAQWANQQGLTTKPCRRKRTKSEKMTGVEVDSIPKLSRKVTEKTIEVMLCNPFYIGKIIHGDQWITSTAHQPLIDSKLFYKVQAVAKKKTTSIHYPELSFQTYRGLLRCGGCNRAYTPYEQKGIIYYRCRCRTECVNTIKNINEAFITTGIQKLISKIAFSDAELVDIERDAHTQLNTITERRNTELEDSYRQLNKAMADLDYLSKEKLSFLRNQVMTIEEIKSEENRLQEIIDETQTKIKANSESTRAMLDYIITFSELIKNASLYFEHALNSEKRELTTHMFTELIVQDGNVKCVAKEGFAALLGRFDDQFSLFGSPHYVFTELPHLYYFVKYSNQIKEFRKVLAARHYECSLN
jgi:DNA invertase Pin-like site-specific DNA recombinase